MRRATAYPRVAAAGLFGFALLVALAAACAPPPVADPTLPGEATVAIVGAHVLPLETDRILSDHTVLVRGDRIVEVGPAALVEVPAGAQVIDGAGRYLIPGMAEMHGHIPPPRPPREALEETLFLFVANGVTTVRGMLGHPNQLELREQAARGEIIAPTLYLAGPSFSGTSIDSPEQAVERARQQRQAGWDLLKIHPGLTLEEYEAVARTAHQEGIRFAGHVPAEVGIERAIELGQDTFDHLDGYVEALDGRLGPVDPAALDRLVRMTLEAGAGVVPTMALWEVLLATADLDEVLAYDELAYMPREAVAGWRAAFERRSGHPDYDPRAARNIAENRIRVLSALYRGGVTVLFGTDAPQQFSVPGFSIHREIPFMTRAGMSNHAILASATVEVGRYFAEQDRFGTIAPGERADLVLLDGNPLADLGALEGPAGVMLRGRWLPREEIEGRLAEIAARHRH
jgi:imidazolonepropionase-like amidohydrolase